MPAASESERRNRSPGFGHASTSTANTRARSLARGVATLWFLHRLAARPGARWGGATHRGGARWHDKSTQLRPWRKDAEIAGEVRPRWWHESREPTDKLDSVKHEVGGAIAPRLLWANAIATVGQR